jgi:protein-disulfide isomerase
MKIFHLIAVLFALFSCSEKTKDNNTKNAPEQLQTQEIETPQIPNINHDQNLVGVDNSVEASLSPTSAGQDPQDLKNSQSSKYNVDVINPNDIVWGDPNSRVLLIEYSSVTCPYCANYREKTFKQIKEKYIDTKKIAYVLRLYVSSQPDFYASTLAMCDKSKFKAFVDILYARQQSWAFSHNYEEILTNLAQLGGVSPADYKKCLNDQQILEELLLQSKSLDEKFKPNLLGIPAFLLNGQLLLKSHSFAELSSAIDKALAE